MQTFRDRMKLWVREAMGALGGEAKIAEVAKHLWDNHQNDFKQAGEKFYFWQYDMRWAANALRREGKMSFRKEGSRSVWVLKP